MGAKMKWEEWKNNGIRTWTARIRWRLVGVLSLSLLVLRNDPPWWLRVSLFLTFCFVSLLIYKDTLKIDRQGIDIKKNRGLPPNQWVHVRFSLCLKV